MNEGIDVSSWQTKVDFVKVKNAGYSFVIIRAGFGITIDNCFETYIKAAANAGLHIGAYWYFNKCNTAFEQASKCVEVIAPYRNIIDMPVYCDYECTNNTAHMIQSCNNFCAIIEKAGYTAGVYSNAARLEQTPELVLSYSIWCADWRGTCGISSADMWQYTSKGVVNGVSGKVDINKLLDTTIIKSAVNTASMIGEYYKAKNYVKTYDTLAREIVAGKWGNGVDRKSRIENAGYDYILAQHIVTNIMGGKA